LPPRPATRRALLDVNVLIALLDDAHVFSRRANEWLDAAPRAIATCPIVENGVVRIMSAPAYSATHRATPGQVAEGLRALAEAVDHAFWPDNLSVLDEGTLDFTRLHGHRQITDAYLLALAVRQGGVLATFDAAVPLSAVRGATRDHLLAL
jgi:toxin-antitoxin system PIN domain toxin